MVASGIPPLAAIAMSILVFAGASMVAAAQLLASSAPAALIVLTVAIINLRLMMYSASLRPHFAGAPLGWRLALAYLTADNVYALALGRFADHPDDPGKLHYFLGAGVLVWIAWQLAVAAGVPAGWRLEFAAPLAFVAISVPLLRDRAMIAAALAGGITVVLAQGLPLRLAIIAAAVVGIAVGLIFDRRR